MIKKLFISCMLVLLMIFVHQNSWAEGTGLPKAPNWAFGAEVPTFNEVGLPYKGSDNGLNLAVENAKIINSWGYKAKPIDEIKDLLPEEFYDVLKHPEIWGNFRINEIEDIPIPSKGTHWGKYREYTEKYKGTCSLDEKGSIKNYKAGRPFTIEEADKDVMKLMWNWQKTCYCDDSFIQFLVSNIDESGFVRNAFADHIVMRFDDRLVKDPQPLYTPNPKGIENILAFPYRYPYNVAGTIMLTYRYFDPDKDDDMWMYIPAMRRVRRMSTAQRQDRMPAGMNYIYDTNEGFQGKLERWKWKLIGKKVMLSAANSSFQVQMDVKGHLMGVDNRYYRTPLYIVEGTPEKAITVSKIRLYIDPERFQIPYAINYDIKGRPWFFQYYGYAYDAKWFPGPVNMFSIDLQRRYTTRAFFSRLTFNEGRKPDSFTMETLKQKYQQR
jgi:hypothetical protein